MVAPPFVITEDEIDTIVERLARAIEVVGAVSARPVAVGTLDAGRRTQGGR
jgi:hypothetical protein